MRYFLTGATGFLGGALARLLRDEGHEVVALVRDPAKATGLVARGVEAVPGDITEPDTLRPPMAGADGVFHVAAWYQVGERNARVKAEAINVQGTRNVLEAMRDLGIPKGVYTSTLAVFSDTGGRQVDETYRFTGTHLSLYDETKARAHYEVALPMMEAGLPLVIVQPGVIYGPGDTSQMGAVFADWMAGKMVQVPKGVSYCWAHVDDVARAHLLAMERGRIGESYIVSGPCHSLEEAFEIAAQATGRKPPRLRIPVGVMRVSARLMGLVEKAVPLGGTFSAETLRVMAGTSYLGDNAKARRELGYAPRALEEGMRETLSTVEAQAG